VYSSKVRGAAFAMLASGASISAVSRAVGAGRSTIRYWRDHPVRVGHRDCPQCDDAKFDRAAYACLLGFYMGDGCISAAARCHYLRVSCDAKLPGIVREVEAAIRGVRPDATIHRVRAPGACVVSSAWVHWPCLSPQDGPGRKHERPIRLEPWQSELVAQYPAALLRGLFHSDGCRATNVIRAPRTGKTYSYPRWMFSNRSEDIHAICQWALDVAGIEWKRAGWHTCVSRRDAVARLDGLIGLKT
jgi:hypothetical protein